MINNYIWYKKKEICSLSKRKDLVFVFVKNMPGFLKVRQKSSFFSEYSVLETLNILEFRAVSAVCKLYLSLTNSIFNTDS